MRLRLFGRGDHFGLAGLRATIKQVLPHRPVQQRAVLLHHADHPSQTVLRDGTDVLPVNANRPSFNVVEPQKLLHQGRLARAGPPYKTDLFALPDGQIHVVEATGAPPVVVAETFNCDFAFRQL